jgi:hypothetical protein
VNTLPYWKPAFLRRKAADPAYRALLRCRKKFWCAMRSRSDKRIDLIGCTPAQLRAHIESQWVIGMSWSNRSAWHVDHIVGCKEFNLLDPAAQRACFHYSNLQPVWPAANYAKNRKRR